MKFVVLNLDLPCRPSRTRVERQRPLRAGRRVGPPWRLRGFPKRRQNLSRLFTDVDEQRRSQTEGEGRGGDGNGVLPVPPRHCQGHSGSLCGGGATCGFCRCPPQGATHRYCSDSQNSTIHPLFLLSHFSEIWRVQFGRAIAETKLCLAGCSLSCCRRG